jgi:hypothetical protein
MSIAPRLETFAMHGKSQPTFAPIDRVNFYLPDEEVAAIDALRLEVDAPTVYTLKTPEGALKTATFLRWHGAHALFYVAQDDVTLAVSVTVLTAIVARPM